MGLRGGLGLRSRIVGVVLVTTVATLAVAAVGILGPLEHELRSATLNTLVGDLHQRNALAGFTSLDLGFVLDTSPRDPLSGERNRGPGHGQRLALQQEEQTLGAALGADVTLFGYPDASGNAESVPTGGTPSGEEGMTADVRQAFLGGRLVKSFGEFEGASLAQVALPLSIRGRRFVLEVRRPITEVTGAVNVVRNAFLLAALAGLALTLLLGIPLSGRLVRRLRRLREAAVQMSQEGLAGELPPDRARDEVGDLSRTLSVMQRRLHSQEQARRAFVATASHELRTPLTSLEGMLELLNDELQDEHPDLQDAQDLLARARAQSRRLGHLAADLLDLSRIDAQTQLRSEPVELGELSRAVLAEFERGSRERSISCRLQDPEGPVWALGDPGSVARILRILLDNALRHSPQGSHVTVSLHRGAQAVLAVSDEGPGVAAEDRERIFERFHRGRDTGGQAGFGLGLAIGRELAERMGGTLTLEPPGDGGACFILHLPLAVAPEQERVPVS